MHVLMHLQRGQQEKSCTCCCFVSVVTYAHQAMLPTLQLLSVAEVLCRTVAQAEL